MLHDLRTNSVAMAFDETHTGNVLTVRFDDYKLISGSVCLPSARPPSISDWLRVTG
jgi:hypothetical protein